MSWGDVVAVVAIVQSVPVLAENTFVTLTPKLISGQPPLPYPYALIHPTGGTDEQARLTGPVATEHPEFTIHVAGDSAQQCQVVTDLLKAKIVPAGVGVVPVVDGRRNERMFWRQPIPIQTSTGLTPPMCFAVVEVGWTSNPS